MKSIYINIDITIIMAAKKANEPRTYLRVPQSFYDLVDSQSKMAGVSQPEYLEGKKVVPIGHEEMK
jgi:hypothetical protein